MLAAIQASCSPIGRRRGMPSVDCALVYVSWANDEWARLVVYDHWSYMPKIIDNYTDHRKECTYYCFAYDAEQAACNFMSGEYAGKKPIFVWDIDGTSAVLRHHQGILNSLLIALHKGEGYHLILDAATLDKALSDA